MGGETIEKRCGSPFRPGKENALTLPGALAIVRAPATSPEGESESPVKSCLLICAPRVPAGSHFTRPLRDTEFFHEALSAAKHGVELLHPTTTGAPSFPFWVDQDAGGQRLLVPDRRLQNTFQSPSRSEGLLYLDNPAPSDLRLTFGGARYHYSRMAAGDFALPDSLFFRKGGVALTNRLLREARAPSSELTPWQVDAANPDRPPDGWMNPLLLRLDLSGDACMAPPAGALPSDTRVVFRHLMQQADVLGMVPGFDTDDDVRWAAWQQLLSSGQGPLNAIERLAAGAAGSETARTGSSSIWAYVALDALGGLFSVTGHGETQSERHARQPLEYRWHPPQRLAPNASWIATRLVEAWSQGRPLVGARPKDDSAGRTRARRRREPGGQREVRFSQALDAAPSGRALSASSVIAFPGRTLAVAPRKFAQRELLAATRSVLDFVRLCGELESNAEGGIKVIAGFFERLFEGFRANAVPFAQELHLGWMRRIGEERLALDAAGLLNELAKRYVTPRSPLAIRMPDPEKRGEAVWFDPIACVPSGDRALLWGLLRPKTSEAERIISLTMGWWNSWHESLLDDPADVSLRFRAAGFELGLALLGGADLGGSPSASGASQVLRFSVPL